MKAAGGTGLSGDELESGGGGGESVLMGGGLQPAPDVFGGICGSRRMSCGELEGGTRPAGCRLGWGSGCAGGADGMSCV